MTFHKAGWTVFCVEEAAGVIESMPPPLKHFMIRFFCDFAVAGAAAIGSGGSPPGDPQDDAGVAYCVAVASASVFFDYVVLADIQEFRITKLVWLG
ncbi:MULTISPECIES: hypothetical protein [Actinomadura]|uniref:hypothetical protein n=1 Tax=Actinomadura TaxID=1988 RepID=UPI002603BACA|nr:hypothetical protein [Actinomadura geliboluensis]